MDINFFKIFHLFEWQQNSEAKYILKDFYVWNYSKKYFTLEYKIKVLVLVTQKGKT